MLAEINVFGLAAGDDDGQNLETITNGMIRHLFKKKCGDNMFLSMARHCLVHVQITPRNTKFSFLNTLQITVGRKEKG